MQLVLEQELQREQRVVHHPDEVFECLDPQPQLIAERLVIEEHRVERHVRERRDIGRRLRVAAQQRRLFENREAGKRMSLPGRDRDHRRRVEAAAEERADRHVGHHPQRDALLEQIREAIDVVLGRQVGVGRGERLVEVPVTVRRGLAAVGPHDVVAGRKRFDARHERRMAMHVRTPIAPVELARTGGMGQERFHLRRKQQLASGLAVVERLDAETVAREEQAPRVRIPERDREHAEQARERLDTPFFIQMDDDLAVRFGAEGVLAPQRAPQILVVVDLAVDGHDDGPVFVGDRLPAALGVHDRQPAEDEVDRVREQQLFVVGAAQAQLPAHRPQDAGPVALGLFAGRGRREARKAAHKSRPIFAWKPGAGSWR
jgi:hypothetical protein